MDDLFQPDYQGVDVAGVDEVGRGPLAGDVVNIYREIHEILEEEPVEDQNLAMMGLLARIGIQKGGPDDIYFSKFHDISRFLLVFSNFHDISMTIWANFGIP